LNHKTIKAGILIILIVIPAFIFLFLEFFGSNVFALPYLFPVAISSPDKDKPIALDRPYPDRESLNFLEYMGNPDPEGSDTLYLKLPLLSNNFKKNESSLNTMIFFVPEPFRAEVNLIIKRMNSRLEKGKINNFVLYPDMQTQFDPGSDEGIILELVKNRKASGEEIPAYLAMLVDERGFIRGLYSPHNPEDADRMIVETEVLIKE
jgi:protein SCO1